MQSRKALFIVSSCIENASVNTLIIALQGCGVSVQAMENARTTHGIQTIAHAFTVASPEKQTTALHTLVAESPHALLDWFAKNVLRNVRKLYEVRETGTLHNILHTLAQRVFEQENRDSLKRSTRLIFIDAPLSALTCRDSADNTPMHYLALMRHEELYRELRETHPSLAAQTQGAETLRADKLSSDLLGANTELRVLRDQIKAERDAYESLEVRQDALSKALLHQKLNTEILERRLGENINKKKRIKVKELEFIGIDSQNRELIEKLQREREEALAEASRAREAFCEAASQLEAAQGLQEERRDALEVTRSSLQERNKTVEEITGERTDLQQQLNALREKQRAAEADASKHDEEKDKLRGRLNHQITQLEEEMEDLDARCAAAESTRDKALQEVARMESEIKEQETELARLQTQYRDARVHNEQLQADLHAANERQRQLQQQLDDLEIEKAELQVLQERNNTEKQDLKHQLAAERELLDAKLRDAQALVDKANAELEEERELRKAAQISAAADAHKESKQLLKEKERREKEAGKRAELVERAHQELQQRLQSIEEQSRRELTELNDELAETRQRAEEAERAAKENYERVTEWAKYHDDAIEPVRSELSRVRDALRVAQQQLEEWKTLSAEQQVELQQRIAQLEEEAVAATGEANGDTLPLPKKKQRPLRASDNPPTESNKKIQTLRREANAANDEDLRREEDIMRCNIRLNMNFWTALTRHVSCACTESTQNAKMSTGSHSCMEEVKYLLLRHLSANSRDVHTGRCLLETATRAAGETHAALKTLGDDGARRVDKQVAMIEMLLSYGAEWNELPQYLSDVSSGCTRLESGKVVLVQQDPRIVKLLENRDDYSPFVHALVSNDPLRLADLVDDVEDLDRVPTFKDGPYKDKGFSLVHIAVMNAVERGRGSNQCASESTLQALVRKGASCTIADNQDRAPLHLALVKNISREVLLRVCEYLMAGGADPTEPTTYKPFLDMVDKDSSVARKAVSVLTRRTKSNKQLRGEEAVRAEKCGTPKAFAQKRGDKQLLELFTNQRYRKMQLEQLTTYVQTRVGFRCMMEELENIPAANDELKKVCERYQDVFEYFNPRFTAIYGTNKVEKQLQIDAGVKNDDTYPEMQEKVLALVQKDISFIDQITNQVRGLPVSFPAMKELSAEQRAFVDKVERFGTEKCEANRSPLWEVGSMVKKFTHALIERWFDVSDMIHRPAALMFPDACVAALCFFIEKDKLAEMRKMVGRSDRLYGDLQYETIVHPRQQYRCIDLAAHYGALDCFEFLMSQQRDRLRETGPCHRTLVSIADKESRTLAVVAYDKFLFDQGMTPPSEKYANAQKYGSVDEKTKETVLHACVRKCRDDLLGYCLDRVLIHLKAEDQHGQTPLELAKITAKANGVLLSSKLRDGIARCTRMLQAASDGVGGNDDTESTSDTTLLKPPPPLAPPPSYSGAPVDIPILRIAEPISTPQSAANSDDDEEEEEESEALTPRSRERHHRRHRHKSEPKEHHRRRHKDGKDKEDAPSSAAGSRRKKSRSSRRDDGTQSEIY